MPCIFTGEYHDLVWGTPVLSSQELFAQLSLASQQAGVSWRIVWNKRHDYKAAFYNWDMRKIAAMGEADLDRLCDKDGPWVGRVMQHRNKLSAIIHNAKQCVAIDDATPGGLSGYLWSFVAEEDKSTAPLLEVRIPSGPTLSLKAQFINNTKNASCGAYQNTFGQTSEVSDRLEAVLRKKNKDGAADAPFAEPFRFLGSITIQAFLLQCGLLNGHCPSCSKNPRCCGGGSKKRKQQEQKEAPATTYGKKRKASSSASADDVWL